MRLHGVVYVVHLGAGMSGLLLSNGTLIDGTGTGPRAKTSVFMNGDRIVSLGVEAETAAAASNATVIDVSGNTVMPGLIDAHVHVTLGEPSSNDEIFHRRSPAEAAFVAAHSARRILQAGVTSFLDVDGLHNIGPALRDAIASGAVEGPTMKVGTYALMTAVGGTAGRFIPNEGTAGYAEVVHGREEIVRVVRRQVKDGADVIKIHVTGSIPNRTGEISVWTRDELKTVCDTAHDLGVRVSAHCRGNTATLDAALSGVDIIWHASYLGEQALEAIVDRKVAVGPVFTFLANLNEYGAKAGSTSSVREVFLREMEDTGAMLRRAYDAGVPLLCGSESGFSITPYGNWHAREMEIFVKHLGLTPLQAITCCTETNAIALGEQGKVGTIKPGCRADILVVDGDPSLNVSMLGDKSRFRHLICRGRQVDLTPVADRRPLATEKVVPWSQTSLTWDLAHS